MRKSQPRKTAIKKPDVPGAGTSALSYGNGDDRMEYEIIFYHSGKTSETERLLDKKLSKLHLVRRTSTAAVDPQELAEALAHSLTVCDIVIIIGGLDGGRQSTDSILSMILSAKEDHLHCEKLVDGDEHLSYCIRAEQQCILVFPDDPQVMEEMLNKRLLRQLKKDYTLREEESDAPSLETVTAQLQKQLADQDTPTSDYHAQVIRRQETELKRLLVGTIVSAAVGVILLVLAFLLH